MCACVPPPRRVPCNAMAATARQSLLVVAVLVACCLATAAADSVLVPFSGEIPVSLIADSEDGEAGGFGDPSSGLPTSLMDHVTVTCTSGMMNETCVVKNKHYVVPPEQKLVIASTGPALIFDGTTITRGPCEGTLCKIWGEISVVRRSTACLWFCRCSVPHHAPAVPAVCPVPPGCCLPACVRCVYDARWITNRRAKRLHPSHDVHAGQLQCGGRQWHGLPVLSGPSWRVWCRPTWWRRLVLRCRLQMRAAHVCRRAVR